MRDREVFEWSEGNVKNLISYDLHSLNYKELEDFYNLSTLMQLDASQDDVTLSVMCHLDNITQE